MNDLVETYRARLQQRQNEAEAAKANASRLSNARLVLFIAGVPITLVVFKTAPLWAPALLIPTAVFVTLVVAHGRARTRAADRQAAFEFYARATRRLDDRWGEDGPTDAGPHDGEPEAKGQTGGEHLFADDLDVFGPHSLFCLLDTSTTPLGKATLARWLVTPPGPETSRRRQQAVAALAPELDLAERVARIDPQGAGGDPALLAEWATESRAPLSTLEYRLAFGLALAAAATGLTWALDVTGLGPLGVVAVIAALVGRRLGGPRRALLFDARRAAATLPQLQGLLTLAEARAGQGPDALPLFEDAAEGATLPTHALDDLERLLGALETAQLNPFWAPVAFLAQRHVFLARRIEAWLDRHGRRLPAWVAAAGEFEALVSLGTYAREHESDAWPELVDGEPRLAGHDIGHPLLPASRCVRNDIDLDVERNLLVISGSNMSGKTTWLRALGVNVLLARLGAPVRAADLRLSPLAVGASIRITDSLADGVSRFYAEIRRLAALDALASESGPCLLLLDEILSGTNSADRLRGARASIARLVEHGALVLVTTHDLALTAIADDLAPRATNVHFADDVVDGEMRFDYRMRPGVVDRGNALRLMRALGLPV